MAELPPVAVEQLQYTIHSGTIMWVTDKQGWITGGRLGLYGHDTRYLSFHEAHIEGLKLRFLTAQPLAYNCVVLT